MWLTLCVCSLVEADVLVNLITCDTSNLAKAGAVSASLLSVAGNQLQTVSTSVSVEDCC